MLERLLEEIRRGGTLQPAALAARLDVSAGLVEAMLEDLERRGVLARLASGCGDSCGGCPLAGGCTAPPSGRVWMLRGAKKQP